MTEAILAVESAVRTIDRTNNLDQALAALNAHPALRDAVAKFYGYTRNESGIRHPLLQSDVEKIGIPKAAFMFAACASFTYLISRAREAKAVRKSF